MLVSVICACKKFVECQVKLHAHTQPIKQQRNLQMSETNLLRTQNRCPIAKYLNLCNF